MDNLATVGPIMQGLKEKLNALLDYIPTGRRIVRIDLPIHLNVGDLLIDLGTETFLRENNRTPWLRLSVDDYRRFLKHIRPDDVILLHGGGNMNDIWLEGGHEELRQTVLKTFPNNKIVVCPQTVHFSDIEAGRKFLKTYEDHKDCIIFTRDQASYDFVTLHSKARCQMSPDMAHALWRTWVFNPEVKGTGEMIFIRRDRESAGVAPPPGSIDWNDLITKMDKLFLYHVIQKCFAHNSFLWLHQAMMWFWFKRRDVIIARAVRTFQSRASIRTDRLHSIILGCLLGRNVAYIDNSYGKLSTYCDAWLPGAVTRVTR